MSAVARPSTLRFRCIKPQAPTKRYSRIMLLGEAPGAEEEAQGAPFVGRSGKLLDALLERAELDRATLFITNVFHIRPKDNDVMQFFTGEDVLADQVLRPYKYKGAMLKAEYGDEIGRLMTEIKVAKPRAIVAMGATALWALLGRTDISACLGIPLTLQNHIVLPMFHPSFLLRSHNEFYNKQAVEILQSAIEYSGMV